MRGLGLLFVVSMLVACSHGEDKARFVKSGHEYEHFILGSNAPEKSEQQKIDAAVAANIDQEMSKLPHSDRDVINEILLSIYMGQAKDYVLTDYAQRINDPKAAAFWSEVLRVAAMNQTFQMCSEREMQMASSAFVGHRAFEPGSDVRVSCDDAVTQRVGKQPELWRVRNEMLWSCTTKNGKNNVDDAELTAKAQAYLKGRKLGAYGCK